MRCIISLKSLRHYLKMPIPQNLGKHRCDVEYGEWGMVPCAANDHQNARLGSGSSQASQSCSSGDICRICHCESDTLNPLLAPCYCSGSLKYVHQTCLQQWLTASDMRSCELCKFPFIMHTKIKPFNEWRRLEMSGVERRRLCCAVLFHCVAALCVIWSLFVLIDRAAEEVQRGLIAWPFWTKLVVVAVGFTGGAVFMYIQCRQYLHLCNRWRSHNRILLIQNAPEKVHIMSPSPVLVKNVTGATSRQQGVPQRFNFGQVVANIENNPNNQGRTLQNNDDSESGENDSCIENIKDNSKLHNMETKSTTSVFLENRDILGESRIVDNEFRHSTLYLDKKIVEKANSNRRYSDTKLLQNLNITNFLGVGVKDCVDGALGTSIDNAKICDGVKNIHDIVVKKETKTELISSNSKTDILQLTIKQIMDLDLKSNNTKRSILSLDQKGKDNYERLNTVFKSLPNLSSSSENLLP